MVETSGDGLPAARFDPGRPADPRDAPVGPEPADDRPPTAGYRYAAAGLTAGVGCLVVTGGHAPTRAILDSARRREVPVLRLRTDTRTALDRVGEIVAAGRTRDEATVERMKSLLAEHADLESILGN